MERGKTNTKMSKSMIKKDVRKCSGCGSSYEVRVIKLMGATLPIPNLCPKCNKKKELEAESLEKQTQERQLKFRRDNWRSHSGIPPRFQSERFETFKPQNDNNKRKLSLCADYANKFPLNGENYKSFALFSSKAYEKYGNGKSHLTCSIGHRIIDRWDWKKIESPIYYVTEPDLFSRIRATFSKSGNSNETEVDVYNQITNVPLLIIDDVGKEDVSDPRFVQRVWYHIVNGRYDNLKPIVITANLDPDEIAMHLGGSRNNEASFDRLYEMLGGVFDEITGKSYRRIKNA